MVDPLLPEIFLDKLNFPHVSYFLCIICIYFYVIRNAFVDYIIFTRTAKIEACFSMKRDYPGFTAQFIISNIYLSHYQCKD